MKFEISNEATMQIAEAIGHADPATINKIFERVAMDKQLLLSPIDAPVSPEDEAAIREGLADLEEGRTQSLDETDDVLRQKFGFVPRS
ncbi:hypothetical protein [Rhodopirellula bahusiensis]|uniref:hypothetical protein n=1 Tax=Rhodopirellula bahusiensis TaxID=2014065 RepID=UPI00329802DC